MTYIPEDLGQSHMHHTLVFFANLELYSQASFNFIISVKQFTFEMAGWVNDDNFLFLGEHPLK